MSSSFPLSRHKALGAGRPTCGLRPQLLTLHDVLWFSHVRSAVHPTIMVVHSCARTIPWAEAHLRSTCHFTIRSHASSYNTKPVRCKQASPDSRGAFSLLGLHGHTSKLLFFFMHSVYELHTVIYYGEIILLAVRQQLSLPPPPQKLILLNIKCGTAA